MQSTLAQPLFAGRLGVLVLACLLATAGVACGVTATVADAVTGVFDGDDEAETETAAEGDAQAQPSTDEIQAGLDQNNREVAALQAQSMGAPDSTGWDDSDDNGHDDNRQAAPAAATSEQAAAAPADGASESRTVETSQTESGGGRVTVTRTETRSTSTRTSSSSRSDDSDGRSLATGGSAEACFGNFYLGESAYIDRQAGIGQACDGGMPTNCLDGMYITDDQGNCVCTARCGVDGGECAEDWTCTAVQATNSTGNRAMICAYDGWFLCRQ